MGKVPTNVVGHDHEPRNERLAHAVSGDSTISIGTQATVLGDRTKAIDGSPHSEEWQQPQAKIDPWVTSCGQNRKDEHLDRNNF